MADDQALRQRRSRMHRQGDHSLCLAKRCPTVALRQAPVTVLPPTELPESDLVRVYRRELEEHGRLDTADGEHVMKLVRRMDQDEYTASALAALSRELRAAMEQALRGAAGASSALDELRARRAKRRSA